MAETTDEIELEEFLSIKNDWSKLCIGNLEDEELEYYHDVVMVPYGIARDLFISGGIKMLLLEGNNKHKTLVKAVQQPLLTKDDTNGETNRNMKMNYIVRQNVNVKVGDAVSFQLYEDVEPGTYIQVKAVTDTLYGLTGDIRKVYLEPYFDGTNRDRPICKGDSIVIQAAMHKIEFKVMETKPNRCCIVRLPGTTIDYAGSITRQEAKSTLNQIGYHDIGGMKNQLAKIKAMVELALRRPVLFETTGADQSRRILLHGPSGTGKSLVARAVANETGSIFVLINGLEIASKSADKSEEIFHEAFEIVKENSPAIIFIDKLDAIVPKHKKPYGGFKRRIESQYLTLMDNLKQFPRVVVMAATNDLDEIDPKLCFDLKVQIDKPSLDGRLEILRICTKNWKLADDGVLERIAGKTQEYVGAQLNSICSEALSALLRLQRHSLISKKDEYDVELLNRIFVDESFLNNAVLESRSTNSTINSGITE
ncbi:unnamed protein product [Adineta steineri]|uniref:AAA+ ATPase domain-containing protein n=1 Tax=Adineta steineri TaxID=433720 RepID=A0A813T7B7_9BILA|nr:unnamed protein product [Adineta steineri]CAF4205408.1 unnamed protein product [Adineta steineri]